MIEGIDILDVKAKAQKYIENALKGGKVFEMAAERSHWHPAGFFRISFFDDNRTRTHYRFHHWRVNDELEGDAAIHSHSWHAVSHLLLGQMLNEEFALVKGDNFNLIEVKTPAFGKMSYNFLGLTNVALKFSEVYEGGQSYEIKRGILHRSTPIGSECITLFCRGVFRDHESLLVEAKDRESNKTLHSRRDRNQLERSLRQIYRLI